MAPYEQFHIRLVIPPSHLKFKMLFSFLHWEMRLGCNYILGQKGATPSLRTIDRTQSAVDSGTGLSDSTLPVNSHWVCFSHIVSNSQRFKWAKYKDMAQTILTSAFGRKRRPGSANSDCCHTKLWEDLCTRVLHYFIKEFCLKNIKYIYTLLERNYCQIL